MPDTRRASRQQKRKRSVPVPILIDSDPDSDQSSADPRIIQSLRAPTSLLIPNSEIVTAPGLRNEFRPKKKPKPGPQRALPPTVNTTSAKGKARADMPVVTAQLEQGDWLGLLDHILKELKERFGPSGANLSGATQTFLCEILSAILLRFYRVYSLEKLFGERNSGPKGAVKDAIEQDNQEMSFEALAAFAARHSYRPISTVKGNRAPLGRPKMLTGKQFFDCIWGDRPQGMSRGHWDTAVFRQQYRRIRADLDIPGPAQEMRRKLEETLEYRFFQSQTAFSYPDPNNGTFATTSKAPGGERPRKVWYHQIRLPNEEVSIDDVERVERCNDDPIEYGEDWKPQRLPKTLQSWELVIAHCRKHRLHFTSQ